MQLDSWNLAVCTQLTIIPRTSQDSVWDKGREVAELIRLCKHVVVFTGAGISTAAGIGDYRGKSGKWTTDDMMSNMPGIILPFP